MYNTFGLPFQSPTINMFMSCNDFMLFCEDLPRYLSAEFRPYTGLLRENYPLADLDGITLHLVHYPSFENAKVAWERRKQRVKMDNIFLVCTDQEGYNEELSSRFDALPYPKVLFVHLEDKNPNHFYIRGYEQEPQVGNLMKKTDATSGRRVMDQFNWVDFLNRS